MFKINIYYKVRIKKYFPPLLFIFTTLALTINSFVPAMSESNRFDAKSAIYIETDNVNQIRVGTNQLNPVKYKLNIDDENLDDQYSIENGSQKFPIIQSNGKYYVDGYVSQLEMTTIFSQEGNYSQPLPVILENNLNLGKITFEYASTKMTPGGYSVLKKIAMVISKTNMRGIYLVGNADKTGSDSANLRLSNLRVNKISKLLEKNLIELNYSDYEISKENMADFLAQGKDGFKNEADRSVTVLIYPIG